MMSQLSQSVVDCLEHIHFCNWAVELDEDESEDVAVIVVYNVARRGRARACWPASTRWQPASGATPYGRREWPGRATANTHD